MGFVNELETKGGIIVGEVLDVNGRCYLAQEDHDTGRTNVYRLDGCKLSTDEGWTKLVGGFQYVEGGRMLLEPGVIPDEDKPELSEKVNKAGMYPV